MSAAWRSAADLSYRVFCVVVGGYALWSGGAVLLGAGLRHVGLSRGDAMLNAAMTGSLFYVGILMWGFGAPPRSRPATTIAFLGVLAALAAIWLGRVEAVA